MKSQPTKQSLYPIPSSWHPQIHIVSLDSPVLNISPLKDHTLAFCVWFSLSSVLKIPLCCSMCPVHGWMMHWCHPCCVSTHLSVNTELCYFLTAVSPAAVNFLFCVVLGMEPHIGSGTSHWATPPTVHMFMWRRVHFSGYMGRIAGPGWLVSSAQPCTAAVLFYRLPAQYGGSHFSFLPAPVLIHPLNMALDMKCPVAWICFYYMALVNILCSFLAHLWRDSCLDSLPIV